MANINRKELLKELKKVSSSIGKNAIQEILKGILVEVKNNSIKLSATNTESSVVTSLEYDGTLIPEEFSFVIEGKLFIDIISKLSSDEVEINFKDNNISIKGSGSEFNISIWGEVNQFPNIEEDIRGNTISISSNIFKEVVAKTVGFIAEDELRPSLNAVKIEFKKGSVTGASLDGYRLGYIHKEIENEVEVDFLIPGHNLLNIIKVIDEESMAIKYSNNKGQVGFVVGNTTVYAKQLADTFFDYRSILKYGNCTTAIKVNQQNLYDAVDRVSIMARGNKGKFNAVSFVIKDDEITISTDAEIGNVVEKVKAEVEGKGLTICFNPLYVLEGLKTCKKDEVEIRFTSTLSPGYILEDDFVYLMLPVRMNSSESTGETEASKESQESQETEDAA